MSNNSIISNISTFTDEELRDPSFSKAHQFISDKWFKVIGFQRFTRNHIYSHYAEQLKQSNDVTKTKGYIARALLYMASTGELNLSGDYFRFANKEDEEVKWWEETGENELDIKMPCQLEDYCRFSKPFLGIVAGLSNAGKSAFMLKTIQLNYDKWGDKIHYFCSEGQQDLKEKFDYLKIEKPPKFHTHRRLDNFQDVIVPNAFNIVDYLRVKSEAMYAIQDDILAIHKKTGDEGIALIALQKPPGRDLAYGGMFTVFDPTFYISIDKTQGGKPKIKFVKVKKPRKPDMDIYRWYIECQISHGADMQKVHEGTEDKE
jgi:hypothetical protein